jgi:hypothetical protein
MQRLEVLRSEPGFGSCHVHVQGAVFSREAPYQQRGGWKEKDRTPGYHMGKRAGKNLWAPYALSLSHLLFIPCSAVVGTLNFLTCLPRVLINSRSLARARSLSRARIDHESSCDLEGVHIETAEDMFNINENTTR